MPWEKGEEVVVLEARTRKPLRIQRVVRASTRYLSLEDGTRWQQDSGRPSPMPYDRRTPMPRLDTPTEAHRAALKRGAVIAVELDRDELRRILEHVEPGLNFATLEPGAAIAAELRLREKLRTALRLLVGSG